MAEPGAVADRGSPGCIGVDYDGAWNDWGPHDWCDLHNGGGDIADAPVVVELKGGRRANSQERLLCAEVARPVVAVRPVRGGYRVQRPPVRPDHRPRCRQSPGPGVRPGLHGRRELHLRRCGEGEGREPAGRGSEALHRPAGAGLGVGGLVRSGCGSRPRPAARLASSVAASASPSGRPGTPSSRGATPRGRC